MRLARSTALSWMMTAGLIVAGSAVVAKTTWLSAAELKATFSGKTVTGDYPGGRKFIERYNSDGSLQYEDTSLTSRGKWTIKGTTFCTFYDNPVIGGACFKVTRTPANCIEYYQVGDPAGRGIKSGKPAQSWSARGVIAGEKGSCVDSQSV